jgi:hypothetical protein
MRRLRIPFRHLTYANVVSTIALCVALGGASYAAIELPANSVGPRQLRNGAVTRRALSFPLGVWGVTDRSMQTVAKGPCNSPHRPSEPVHVLCPKPARTGLSSPGRQVEIMLRSKARAAVSAIAGAEYRGSPSTTARILLAIALDGRMVADRETVLTPDEKLQAPAQLLVPVSRGDHRIGVVVTADFSSFEAGEVRVSPVSLIVSAFPPR